MAASPLRVAMVVLLAGHATSAAAIDAFEARLASCDDAVVHAAAAQAARDATVLQEPIRLYQAAIAERMTGNREQAAFLLLAARLRTARQALGAPGGERAQLFAVYEQTTASLILPALQADPAMSRRVALRVREWDRATPDPYRDARAVPPEQMARIDAGLARWLDQQPLDAASLAVVRQSEAHAEQVTTQHRAERCAAGRPELAAIEAASQRIRGEVENLVRSDPWVLQRAGGAISAVSVGSWRKDRLGLPARLTVSVRPASGKLFQAEVDAAPTLDAEGGLASVRVSLACITELSVGERNAGGTDICREDPAALQPPSQ